LDGGVEMQATVVITILPEEEGEETRQQTLTATFRSEIEIEEFFARCSEAASRTLGKGARARKSQGKPLPPDWGLPQPWAEWAIAEFGLSLQQVLHSTELFKIYYTTLPLEAL
jgi:hypothetical protein